MRKRLRQAVLCSKKFGRLYLGRCGEIGHPWVIIAGATLALLSALGFALLWASCATENSKSTMSLSAMRSGVIDKAVGNRRKVHSPASTAI